MVFNHSRTVQYVKLLLGCLTLVGLTFSFYNLMMNKWISSALTTNETINVAANPCFEEASLTAGDRIALAAISMAFPSNQPYWKSDAVNPITNNGFGTDLYVKLTKDIFNETWQMCSAGAATAIRWAGADNDFYYPLAPAQQTYMANSPKWQEITNATSYADLKPGDVLVANNPGILEHIKIYVGNDMVKRFYPNNLTANFVEANANNDPELSYPSAIVNGESNFSDIIAKKYKIYRVKKLEDVNKYFILASLNGLCNTKKITVPDAPVITSVNSSDAQNVVTWTTPNNNEVPIVGYLLQWRRDGGDWVNVSLGKVLNYNHSAISNGSSYEYKISAINFAGTGPASSIRTGTPGIIDYSKLDAIINEFESLDAKKYTFDSYKEIYDFVESSKMNKNYSQIEINNTVQKIRDLINKLIKINKPDEFFKIRINDFSGNISEQLLHQNVIKIYDINAYTVLGQIDVQNIPMSIKLERTVDMKKYNAYKVVYIKNGVIMEEKVTDFDDDYIYFETNHLSVYGVIGIDSKQVLNDSSNSVLLPNSGYRKSGSNYFILALAVLSFSALGFYTSKSIGL